jgi:hypothetical protein
MAPTSNVAKIATVEHALKTKFREYWIAKNRCELHAEMEGEWHDKQMVTEAYRALSIYRDIQDLKHYKARLKEEVDLV